MVCTVRWYDISRPVPHSLPRRTPAPGRLKLSPSGVSSEFWTGNGAFLPHPQSIRLEQALLVHRGPSSAGHVARPDHDLHRGERGQGRGEPWTIVRRGYVLRSGRAPRALTSHSGAAWCVMLSCGHGVGVDGMFCTRQDHFDWLVRRGCSFCRVRETFPDGFVVSCCCHVG